MKTGKGLAFVPIIQYDETARYPMTKHMISEDETLCKHPAGKLTGGICCEKSIMRAARAGDGDLARRLWQKE